MEPNPNEIVPPTAIAPTGAVEDVAAVNAAGADAQPANAVQVAGAAEEVHPHAPVAEAEVERGETEAVTTRVEGGARVYPSLYDGVSTTLLAVALGITIVGGIQFAVAKMYSSSKSEQEYLTRFVTSLVGLVMGAYVADLLIAGPGTYLMSPEEHQLVLGFVKDVAIMIFSFYFGSKSARSAEPSASE